MAYRKCSAFANALLNRHVACNKTIERILELEKQGKVFVIRQEEPLNIGRMENRVQLHFIEDGAHGFSRKQDIIAMNYIKNFVKL